MGKESPRVPDRQDRRVTARLVESNGIDSEARHDSASPQTEDHTLSGWRASDLSLCKDWQLSLDADDLEEIRLAAAAWIRCGAPHDTMRAEDFPLPKLGGKLGALRKEITKGRGFAHIRGLVYDEWDPEARIVACLGIANYMGNLRSQNHQGHILGHIFALGRDDKPTDNDRGYHLGGPMKFHTDSADIVGLYCVRPAQEGGTSKIASAETVFDAIRAKRPDLLEALLSPMPRDRRGDVPSGAREWWVMPIFQRWNGRLYCHLSPDYIRSSQRFSSAPRLSADQEEVLDLIEETANEDEYCLRIPFRKGDLQLLDNHRIIHAREQYRDTSEGRRHLYRLWISPPDAVPLPPSYVQRYGTTKIGARGGLGYPEVVENVPLAPA